MNNDEFFLSGEIKGITKEEREREKEKEKEKKKNINNKMQYIVKKIKEEIKMQYKNDTSFYIYDRFYKKLNILKIFVTLLANTKNNKGKKDITFLIIILEEYPSVSPMVFCLTEFNKNLDIFDMRNILKNLIPEWSDNYSVNDIISKFPSFVENIDFQINNKLLPSVGEYYIKSVYYDINDFLLNSNNKFFRIKIVSREENDEVEFKDMYIIITKNNLIFLKSVNETKKHLCEIKYVINLIGIERIRRFLRIGDQFNGYACFKIVNNKYINNSIHTNIFNYTLCVDEDKLFIKQINELITKRKEEIFNWYKYFENAECNDINEIEKIIEIKKNIIKNKLDDNLYYQIHGLYNKLIEVSSNKDDGNDFSIHVKQLQNFLDDYDKMKNKENENLEKIDEDDDINNNYNFGFE